MRDLVAGYWEVDWDVLGREERERGEKEREKTLLNGSQLPPTDKQYTLEPPNKGHIGTRSFVLYREVSFIWSLKCTGIIGIGTSRFVLYREVFFIQRSFIGGSTIL